MKLVPTDLGTKVNFICITVKFVSKVITQLINCLLINGALSNIYRELLT